MNDRPFNSLTDGLAGRYTVFAELACGGMAMVYLGQLEGSLGFKRSVAVKRMHPQYARDPEFREMFMDEARLVAQIRHPNVVPTLDVVAREDLLLIVMEFVDGESIAQLMSTGKRAVPPRIAAAIAHDALCGLHAAHELTGDDGKRLDVIHRDVSPANILVGKDGMSRILDFGVAKAAGRTSSTRDGSIKGKVPYMPPEQLWGSEIDRTVDTYAAAVVLWEMLTGRRLFKGENDAETMNQVVEAEVCLPSEIVPEAVLLDEVVMRGLSRDPSKRFPTALAMAKAIEKALSPAPRHEIGEWVAEIGHVSLAKRGELLRGMKRGEPAPEPLEVASLASLLTTSGPRTAIGQSLSQPPMPMPPPRQYGIASGAIAILATVATVFAMRAFTPGSASAATSHELTATTAAQHVAPPSEAAAASPPPVAVAVATAAPVAEARTPAASATAAPVRKAFVPAVPSIKRAPAAEVAPKPPGCQLPYTLDAQGNRHFKLECL